MLSTSTKVVKNASAMMASQLITWSLSLLLTIFLPRYLGAAAVGEFVLATSIWAVVGMLINFGTDTYLTKEIARQPNRTSHLVGTALTLRGLLFIVGCGVIAAYLYLMKYPITTQYIVWIIGLSILISQISNVCLAALQGLEIMQYISIAGIANRATNTILGITVVLLGYGLYAVGFVTVTASFVSMTLLFMFLTRRYKLRPHFQIDQAIAMLKSSFPYLMSGLGLIIYGQVDVLIISSLVNTTEIGWYGVASQLFGTLLFIPVVFTTAIFPLLTRTYANAPESLPKILCKSFDFMLLVSIPIGLGICVVANPIVMLLFGPSFAQSGPILSLMGIVLIFTYQNVLLAQFFTSMDRQNSWTLVMLVATAVTIPLDLVLVPWCQQFFGNGAIAGALSFIFTEAGMVVIGIRLMPKRALGWSNVRTAVSVIIAGLTMAAAAWWCRNMFIAIPIVIGAFTYIGMIAVLRVVPKEDIALFKQMVQVILQRLRQREAKSIGITGA
jgi:O-antigen/teichoic acid export membrane protein